MTGPRILFVVDAGARAGERHVRRALILARALAAQGAACTFMGPPAVRAVLETLAPDAVQLAAASTEPRDLAAAIASERFDAVVFDHEGLGERDHRAMGQGRPVLVIDELADRPLGAEIVVDPSPARRAEAYNGLIPDAARLLLGPAFALVPGDFASLRETALAWRGEPVQRFLVAMGPADLGGVTSRVVERLRPRVGDAGLDIVLSAEAPSLAGLAKVARRDPRLSLHVDSPHLARLTAEADIAVGAADSAVWERCTLGLPTILVVAGDAEHAVAASLAEAEAALVVEATAAGFEARFDRALTRLLIDAGLRRELAQRSAALCDGQGAERIAAAFLQKIRAA